MSMYARTAAAMIHMIHVPILRFLIFPACKPSFIDSPPACIPSFIDFLSACMPSSIDSPSACMPSFVVSLAACMLLSAVLPLRTLHIFFPDPASPLSFSHIYVPITSTAIIITLYMINSIRKLPYLTLKITGTAASSNSVIITIKPMMYAISARL